MVSLPNQYAGIRRIPTPSGCAIFFLLVLGLNLDVFPSFTHPNDIGFTVAAPSIQRAGNTACYSTGLHSAYSKGIGPRSFSKFYPPLLPEVYHQYCFKVDFKRLNLQQQEMPVPHWFYALETVSDFTAISFPSHS